MFEIILGLLLPALFTCGLVYLAIRRGLQMRELCMSGITVTGQIFSKRAVRGGSGSVRQRKLAYRYSDNSGTMHEYTSAVSMEEYDRHEEGGPIEVVYSSKNPGVSAPKYLVEECRAAMASQ